MPCRWIRPNSAALAPAPTLLSVLAVLSALTGAGAGAQDLGDPHLTFIARTTAETARIATVTAPPTAFTAPQPFEHLPGGAATVRARTSAHAFSDPSGNLGGTGAMDRAQIIGRAGAITPAQVTRAAVTIPPDPTLDFLAGRGLFRKLWVSSPASTVASDGLGPLYNARSCQSCHIRNGRGHPPAAPGENAVSMILRLSIPSGDDAAAAQIRDYLSTAPDPVYGGQVQDFGTVGQPAEARLAVTYTEVPVALSGGQTASLRSPTYTLADPGYGPLHPKAMFSPRVAPQMIGLGLLEAVPAADILALADPDDADGNGISGRANIVWSVEYGQPMLGRFGLKAGLPTLREQVAAAFSGDMGLSSPLHPAPWGDCTPAQTTCRTAMHGEGAPNNDGRDKDGPNNGGPGKDGSNHGAPNNGGPNNGGPNNGGPGANEVNHHALDLVTFYSRNLGVPARQGQDSPAVLHGKQVFHRAGCAGCHQPAFVTHRLADQPEQSFQLIWPYTDLLLHDMGNALADHRPEGRATGTEWRTPPLWGIGLTGQVSGHSLFLHDGRARGLLEAILWHGGEAQAARDRVVTMPAADRAALVLYLESL